MSAVVVAVDPGPTHSAAVVWDGKSILGHIYAESAEVLDEVTRRYRDSGATLVVEMVASYGKPVGAEVFETCVWIGRFLALWPEAMADRVTRQAVKHHLCLSMTVRDCHVRQALIDRFGCPKGRKCQACKGKGWVGRGRPVCTSCDGSGWEQPPGITQGLTGDKWAAFAVAVTWLDQSQGGSR